VQMQVRAILRDDELKQFIDLNHSPVLENALCDTSILGD
jgi:hypothetical protein